MEQSLQSLHVMGVTFRVKDLPGEETPKSRQTMVVTVLNEQGQEVDLALSLSITQLIEIVKHVFWECTVRCDWAVNFLIRLLTKRWAVYTSPEAKEDPDYRARCTQLDFHMDK